MTRQRRTIPIRDELVTLLEARREIERLQLPDSLLSKHQTLAIQRLPAPQREAVEWNLDPDTSHWSPFEVNDVASKYILFERLNDYIHDAFEQHHRNDRTFAYVPQATMTLRKMYTDPRGINPPEYRLLVDDDIIKALQRAFTQKNKTRIVTWILVGNAQKPEFQLVCVFYRKLDPLALVVELYHPNLTQMDDHPAFDDLNNQLLRVLRNLNVPTIPPNVLIGILDSDLTNEECVNYLPFLARYNTVPDYMFGYLWNAFLFIDRAEESQYTMKEIERIMYQFSQIDVDTRKKVYLAFLEFIARFRYYLYIMTV